MKMRKISVERRIAELTNFYNFYHERLVYGQNALVEKRYTISEVGKRFPDHTLRAEIALLKYSFKLKEKNFIDVKELNFLIENYTNNRKKFYIYLEDIKPLVFSNRRKYIKTENKIIYCLGLNAHLLDYFNIYDQKYPITSKGFDKIFTPEKFINILKESKINPYEKVDEQFKIYEKKFKKIMGSRKSIKTLCVDLLDSQQVYSMSPKEDIINNFEKLKQEMKKKDGFLGHFYKLELGINHQYSVFYVPVFEDRYDLALQSIYQSIREDWEKICTSQKSKVSIKRLVKAVLLTPLIQTKFQSNMFSGMVASKGDTYKKFTTGILNYIANSAYFFPIYVRNSETLENELVPVLANDNDTELKKRTVALTPPKNISFKMVLKSIKMSKPLKDEVKNITKITSLLNVPEQFIEPIQNIEIFVMLALRWKVLATETVGDGAQNSNLGILLDKINIDQNLLHFLEENINCLGYRLFGFFIVCKMIFGTSNFDTSVYLDKDLFIQTIRDVFHMSLRTLYENIEAIEKSNFSTYLPIPQPWEEQLDQRIGYFINHRLENKKLDTYTLNSLLEMKRKARSTSYTHLSQYLNTCQLKHAKKIEVNMSCKSDDEFLLFNKLIRQTIDQLKKIHEGLLGYIGAWDYFSQNEYYLALNLFIDKNYFDGNYQTYVTYLNEAMEVIWSRKLKKNKDLEYNKPIIKLDFFQKYKPVLTKEKINLQLQMKDWAFFIANREMYWLPNILMRKDALLRGKGSYKTRCSTQKVLKNEVIQED